MNCDLCSIGISDGIKPQQVFCEHCDKVFNFCFPCVHMRMRDCQRDVMRHNVEHASHLVVISDPQDPKNGVIIGAFIDKEKAVEGAKIAEKNNPGKLIRVIEKT